MTTDSDTQDARRDGLADVERDLLEPVPSVREPALARLRAMVGADDALTIVARGAHAAESRTRMAAADNLADLHDQRAIPYLIQLARSDVDEQVRAKALLGLTEYHSPEVLECLLEEVSRPKRSRRPRQTVARQLGRYDTEEAVNALQRLIADEDEYVRIFAADSLFTLNRPGLQETWQQALDDSNHYVRGRAEMALSDLLGPNDNT